MLQLPFIFVCNCDESFIALQIRYYSFSFYVTITLFVIPLCNVWNLRYNYVLLLSLRRTFLHGKITLFICKCCYELLMMLEIRYILSRLNYV